MNLRPAGRGTVPNPPNPDTTIYEPAQESGSRSSVLTTDWMLHVGREPQSIDRINNARNRGYVGARQENGFGRLEAAMMPLGHVPLLHRVKGVVPDYGVTVDDRAYVPASMAGNPSESPS